MVRASNCSTAEHSGLDFHYHSFLFFFVSHLQQPPIKLLTDVVLFNEVFIKEYLLRLTPLRVQKNILGIKGMKKITLGSFLLLPSTIQSMK